jgi:hypothetical protein
MSSRQLYDLKGMRFAPPIWFGYRVWRVCILCAPPSAKNPTLYFDRKATTD